MLWRKVLQARRVKELTDVGLVCLSPKLMAGAGYGAVGAMTYLNDKHVAREILAAKRHRRYPRSNRPSSEDRRMIFLGIAVAAGVFGLRFGTALRKLAEKKLGLDYLSDVVHELDRLQEMVKSQSMIWAEPVGNYFWHMPDGKWTPLRELPCAVPDDWQGGYFIYGYGPSGFQAAFSRTLPTELIETNTEVWDEKNDKI